MAENSRFLGSSRFPVDLVHFIMYHASIEGDRMLTITSCEKVKTKKPVGRPCLYPWAELEVNDSFLVTNRSYATMVRVTHFRRDKHPSERYRVEQEVGGVRVWRVA
jgi:hypothetical protein